MHRFGYRVMVSVAILDNLAAGLTAEEVVRRAIRPYPGEAITEVRPLPVRNPDA